MTPSHLIRLSNQLDPRTVESLKSRFPNEKALFQEERPLGDADTGSEASISLLKSTSDTLCAEADKVLASLTRRMTLIRMIKGIGGLASIIGGFATVVSSIYSEHKIAAALIAGILAACGGAATLSASHIERSISGNNVVDISDYSKVMDLRVRIERIRLRVTRHDVNPIPADEVAKMLMTADELAAEVLRYKRN